MVTVGCSDVALARCIAARAAMQFAAAQQHAKREPIEWVLWLDDDVAITKDTVATMALCCAKNERSHGRIVAVSAQYEQRMRPGHLACDWFDDDDASELPVPVGGRWGYTGLGAMLLTAATFERLWDTADEFEMQEGPLRAVTWSGPEHHSAREKALWLSEDYRYCDRLYDLGSGVIICDEARAGHVTTRVAWPKPPTETRPAQCSEAWLAAHSTDAK